MESFAKPLWGWTSQKWSLRPQYQGRRAPFVDEKTWKDSFFSSFVGFAGRVAANVPRDFEGSESAHWRVPPRVLAKTHSCSFAETSVMEKGFLTLRDALQHLFCERYVMRLVRQRDELKQVTKLAEDLSLCWERSELQERDSYYILGLNGPSATEEEVKKAYRNLARKEHPDKASSKKWIGFAPGWQQEALSGNSTGIHLNPEAEAMNLQGRKRHVIIYSKVSMNSIVVNIYYRYIKLFCIICNMFDITFKLYEETVWCRQLGGPTAVAEEVREEAPKDVAWWRSEACIFGEVESAVLAESYKYSAEAMRLSCWNEMEKRMEFRWCSMIFDDFRWFFDDFWDSKRRSKQLTVLPWAHTGRCEHGKIPRRNGWRFVRADETHLWKIKLTFWVDVLSWPWIMNMF